MRLNEPIAIGGMHVPNRLYRAPVLEGAGCEKDPAAAYARSFVPNAEAGVGLIIQGNTIVLPEGRTSPGMTAVDGREALTSLRPMTEAVHRHGTRIVIQLGHGGVFAIEAWHREHRAARSRPPYAASPLPFTLRPFIGRVHVLATDELEALILRFGLVASWAKDAGYDGVQLAASNAKLLHQLLSPVYNRRRDRFGGRVAARARVLVEIREAIAREVGPDYPVLLKMAAEETGPFARMTLDDGVQTARIAEEAGFAAITPVAADVLPNTALCRGGFPDVSFSNPSLQRRLKEAFGSRARILTTRIAMRLAARRYPFESVWNREVFRAVRSAVKVPVLAVGGIRTREEAEGILARGEADLIGIGRPFYAEPDLPRRFLDPAADDRLACASCNRCVVPQMLGMPGVCYNPASQKAAAPREEPALV